MSTLPLQIKGRHRGAEKGKVPKNEKEEARGKQEEEEERNRDTGEQERSGAQCSTALTILVAAPAERPLRFPTAQAHNVPASRSRGPCNPGVCLQGEEDARGFKGAVFTARSWGGGGAAQAPLSWEHGDVATSQPRGLP